MPQIRKKTSNRATTHERAKLKHKIAEGRKKKKKLAKKNPQWVSKKKKDPGIPNDFPYKDQILAEVAETRRQAEEAKQRRKDEKKAAREGGPVEVEDVLVEQSSSSKALVEEEAPLLLNPDLPNLKAVLDKADVVLHVLDARDPVSYRLPHIEEVVLANEKCKLVFVLNKIDLVPRESLAGWAKKLRTQHPTFLFRSASSFLPKNPMNDPKLKGKAKETPDDSIGSEALLDYLAQQAGVLQSDTLQVAVIGLTNSGKSAIVNSLARRPAVPIYAPASSTDAWTTTTTRAYEVQIEASGHKINLVDTPGVSLQNEEAHDDALKTRDMLLRSRGRVDKVKDPVPAVTQIVARANTADLMVHYNLPAFAPGDCGAFLAGVARAQAQLKKGGAPDLTQAARIVLREWTTGRLPYYAEAEGAGDEGGAVDGVRTRKEMRKAGGLVRIGSGEVEVRKVVLEAPFVVEEVESEGEGEGEGEDGGNEEEDEEEDDEEAEDDAEDDEDDDLPTPNLIGKRKRKAKADASAPAPKKVAFAAGTRDNNERQHARNGTKPSKTAGSKKPAASKPTKAAGSKPIKAAASKPAAQPPKKATKVTNATSSKKKDGTDDAYDFGQFFKS